MGGQDKQVAFEDAHSSASDEDAKAVEVTTSCPPLHAPPCPALRLHCFVNATMIVTVAATATTASLPPSR